MATTTITDLPASRALDYKAMLAIKGAGGAPWIFGAFLPFAVPVPAIAASGNNFGNSQLIGYNSNQTNYFANNLTLQNESSNDQNSASSSATSISAMQSSLGINLSNSTHS